IYAPFGVAACNPDGFFAKIEAEKRPARPERRRLIQEVVRHSADSSMRRSGVKKVKVPAGSRIVKRYALPAAAVAVLCIALAAVVTAAGRGGAAEGPWPHDLDVELTALENGVWRLEYRLAVPVRRLDLGPTLGLLREENWRLE